MTSCKRIAQDNEIQRGRENDNIEIRNNKLRHERTAAGNSVEEKGRQGAQHTK